MLAELMVCWRCERDSGVAVKALYVMGGSAHKGNITPTAEFNFHCDPEAAFLVLKKVIYISCLMEHCEIVKCSLWTAMHVLPGFPPLSFFCTRHWSWHVTLHACWMP